MIEDFPLILPYLWDDEGGISDDPLDPGGLTNLGVTKRAWSAHLRRPVTDAEMRALTPSDVTPFYKTEVWDKVKADNLPTGVDYACFDFAVNSGAPRAAMSLQRILGVTVDGIIGPRTIDAALAKDPASLVGLICASRLGFLKALPGWERYGGGWGRRVSDVEARAKSLIDGQRAD